MEIFALHRKKATMTMAFYQPEIIKSLLLFGQIQSEIRPYPHGNLCISRNESNDDYGFWLTGNG